MDTFQVLIQKVLKFGIVGVLGMCVDFCITWMLKEKLKLNKYFANAAGFTVAVLNNFILNYIWTFKDTTSRMSGAFALFFVIALIGLALNSCLVYSFHKFAKLNFYFSKAGATFFVFFWNFGANYFFNFHNVAK
jgi:putative flippase GtrA